MGGPIRLEDYERRSRSFGVKVWRGTKHWRMRKEIGGVEFIYTFTSHNNEVDDVYEKKARKTSRLTPKDGVSDKEFYSR
jgi:hypothetical protein